MSHFDNSAVERLITDATGSLSAASLWFVGTSIPVRASSRQFDQEATARYQAWVRHEIAASWPTPIGVGESVRDFRPDRLAFGPDGGGPATGHYCELHAQGASLVAVDIGKRLEASQSPGAAWSVGEGALAWLSVTFVRLAAAWAAQADVLGQATFDLRLFSPAPDVDQTRVQLWNTASGSNAPASDVRKMPEPSQSVIDLSQCLSTDVIPAARCLLLPLLAQFGHDESRHLLADGSIESENFVGFSPTILTWAEKIGVAVR